MSLNFEHKKSLGQHFLNSDYVPKKMCDAADVQVGDIVLEIGPGTGVLTREILARGAKVIAIEADLRAIESLKDSFSEALASGQLTVHHHDARVLNLTDFNLVNQGYKAVSNIPYYLSGLLFRSLLDNHCQPTTLVFLVQKEVAERIARDKKESLLSLSIKVFGDPTYICTVKRGHFTPPPKVDSAIIAVTGIQRENFNTLDAERFFYLLHLGFGQKRKQLLSNLSGELSRAELGSIFDNLNLSLTVRAEDISLTNWVKLTTEIENLRSKQ
ncbi:MAG: dimethyladenosine transferase, rRNA (adenine1518-N6/adenine1519-N6)-dimethyltransferase [Candidatus Parcubacteria bacterium]|jgi:16S rRNA (adenine1518-N6/adenine1519-N6)-dimethyltransferase